jgi:AcrR family transcriptional regulator
MNQREQQKENRRRQILDVSLDLFVRHGYTGTSTRDISRRIGISSGLMFHYFESKEQLYIALMSTASGSVRMIEEYAKMPMGPLELFREITDSILLYFQVSPTMPKLFLLIRQAFYADYLTREMKAVVSQMDILDKLVPIVKAGQKTGEIRKGNPKALALCYFSIIEGAAEAAVCSPGAPLPDAGWIVDMLRA